MENRKSTMGFIGIGFGAIALLLAVVHFWAGSFSPQPSIEEVITNKAISIKESAFARLKGKDITVNSQPTQTFDADQLIRLAIAILGSIALIFAVIAFAINELPKVAVGAAILGAGALAFQFAIMALAAIVFVFLIAAILNNLSVG
jgi:polyferredoxin